MSTADAFVKQTPYANYVSQFLASQNVARLVQQVPSLVWDEKLASYAKWYANQRQWDCDLRHSNGPYGENIFWGSGKDWTPAQAAIAWVGERRWYNNWSNSCADGQECGHYTQIVWRTTRRIGCARVVCAGWDRGRGVFMTCNYDPPGNYIGERSY
ncbi:CAP (Cysteine-rich secretory proteins, Antigen 5, and Pathogenesis-related 1 protein) superfamily protein [Actinidia rufa]|uniref:CAP (Cysteine-rich secretory proteins, Antigen 5, and Pathogenesis-related 1 protein) superfamily protein n=1 Tax=Actinidia rufa TaxID=165716 RepID=A0A7J0DIU7_9ERIC|nr:CAP (Cysteine-rich secretory proteins, Antigen 5, and Pathogenesis-related 1 protein) superfamily protein [Actinidia rufa]